MTNRKLAEESQGAGADDKEDVDKRGDMKSVHGWQERLWLISPALQHLGEEQ